MRKRLTFTGVAKYEGTYSEWDENEHGVIVGVITDYGSDGTNLGQSGVRFAGRPAELFIKYITKVLTAPQFEGLTYILSDV